MDKEHKVRIPGTLAWGRGGGGGWGERTHA